MASSAFVQSPVEFILKSFKWQISVTSSLCLTIFVIFCFHVLVGINLSFFTFLLWPVRFTNGAHVGAVGWGTALQAGSIPDCVIGIVHRHNPSRRTMTLGSTQPLTETSTRNISCGWGDGKGSRCVGLTTLPPSYADCLEICETQPPGAQKTCLGLYRDFCTFTIPYTTQLNLKIISYMPSSCTYNWTFYFTNLYEFWFPLLSQAGASMSWDIILSIARQWLHKVGRYEFVSW